MLDCIFQIINGQHSIADSKRMIAEKVHEAICKDFKIYNAFVLWTKDMEK